MRTTLTPEPRSMADRHKLQLCLGFSPCPQEPFPAGSIGGAHNHSLPLDLSPWRANFLTCHDPKQKWVHPTPLLLVKPCFDAFRYRYYRTLESTHLWSFCLTLRTYPLDFPTGRKRYTVALPWIGTLFQDKIIQSMTWLYCELIKSARCRTS